MLWQNNKLHRASISSSNSSFSAHYMMVSCAFSGATYLRVKSPPRVRIGHSPSWDSSWDQDQPVNMNTIDEGLKGRILVELLVLERDRVLWSMNGNATTLEEAIIEADHGMDIGFTATAQVGFHIFLPRWKVEKGVPGHNTQQFSDRDSSDYWILFPA